LDTLVARRASTASAVQSYANSTCAGGDRIVGEERTSRAAARILAAAAGNSDGDLLPTQSQQIAELLDRPGAEDLTDDA
jgi:hypothetical protein